MKKHLSTIILIVVFLIGVSLVLYPTVSDYWNSIHQSRAIAGYEEAVSSLDEVSYEHLWEDAGKYNGMLTEKQNRYFLSDEERSEYESLLNVSGDGIMGYLEIPEIKLSLAIYHGVDEAVLRVAAGHVEGTSLPVGGEGTHCALSGHRGLPSAKLFTNLDKLVVGDIFMIRVLDQTLTYEVDRILIVEPQDLDGLAIEEGKDYCTLVTCTPYGVNSHRLLVRGHRIETQESAALVHVTGDAAVVDPLRVAPVIAVPILLLLLIWVMVKYRKRRE